MCGVPRSGRRPDLLQRNSAMLLPRYGRPESF
jgi:hypothetical protein